MKNKTLIVAEKRNAIMVTPKNQTENRPQPATRTDAAIEAIHARADYVGPVLEEILKAGHTRMNWAMSV